MRIARIKGLVRAANGVRQQLQAGASPDGVPQFRKQVASLIREVEAICARQGITPDQLPPPSRQAYQYLKGLDTHQSPLRSTEEPAQATLRIGISNVVKTGVALAGLLWQQSAQYAGSAADRQRIRSNLRRQVDAIERICAQQDVTPAALEIPSRQVYCWLRFLLSEDNLLCHQEALVRARTLVDRSQPSLDRPLCIHLISMAPLWRKRPYRNLVLLKVNEGFLHADQEIWQALIGGTVSGRDPATERLVRHYGESEEFAGVLFELEAFAGPTNTAAQGHIHNLEESFARVNAAYFEGRLVRPNLVWNGTLTLQKFGHYQPSRDTVMLSVSLDQLGVPASLVDYVMYHELLHKRLGVTVVNGRRLVHSPAFREEEHRFSGYEAARRRLGELALRQRAGS